MSGVSKGAICPSHALWKPFLIPFSSPWTLYEIPTAALCMVYDWSLIGLFGRHCRTRNERVRYCRVSFSYLCCRPSCTCAEATLRFFTDSVVLALGSCTESLDTTGCEPFGADFPPLPSLALVGTTGAGAAVVTVVPADGDFLRRWGGGLTSSVTVG